MIEEAAGTRMYESKRASAQRTIEKKDSKLKEIEVVSKMPTEIKLVISDVKPKYSPLGSLS